MHLPLRSTVALALCTAVAAAVAGCGGSSSAASDSSSSNARDAARVKFAQCLRQHGVNIPDNPGQGGAGGAPGNIDQTKFQAAQKACQKFQQAAVGQISATQRQEFQDAFAKFASCMRQQGVELPNFTPGSGPPAGGARLNRDDPKVQAAQKACQSMLPQGGRGGPGGQQGGQ